MNSYPHHDPPVQNLVYPSPTTMPVSSLSQYDRNNSSTQHWGYPNLSVPPPLPPRDRVNGAATTNAYANQSLPPPLPPRGWADAPPAYAYSNRSVPPPLPPREKVNNAAPTNADVDALLAYATYTTPPPSFARLATLPMPLCLPQLISGPTSLFVRGHSPVLEDVGITMKEWLHFVYVFKFIL